MESTCSIIYENEPIERILMLLKRGFFTNTFFKLREITINIIHRLVIALGLSFVCKYCVATNHSESATKAVVFLTPISFNDFRILVNRCFYYSLFTTLKHKNNLVLPIISFTILFTAFLLFEAIFAGLFKFE